MALVGEMQYLTIGNNTYSLPSGGGGTVTSVAVSNATNGGLSISGSPVTSNGTITIGHSNVLTSAQSTQAVYPITIDKNGHIASYGSAITIPSEELGIVALYDDTYSDISTAFDNYKYIIGCDGEGPMYLPLEKTAGGFTFAGIHKNGSDLFATEYTISSSGVWSNSSIRVDYTKWTASSSTNTFYPLVSSSASATSTTNTLNGINFYQYYNTAGGYRRLELGNATTYKSTGGAYGTIRLYGAAATYYGDLVPGTLGTTSGDGHISANRTWTLPDATGTIALTSDIPTVPTNVSAFTNDAGYLTSYTETDPTVPSWAKASTKPSYTASEVGALPSAGGTLTGSIITSPPNGQLAIGTNNVYIRIIDSGGDEELHLYGEDMIDLSGGPIFLNENVTIGSGKTLTLSQAPTSNLHAATKKYVDDAVSGAGSGTVTSVGVSNATNGGLTISGSPITSSGTITVGHSNTITAGTIGSSSASSGSTIDIPYATYDVNGHITGKGTHTHTITGFSTASNWLDGSATGSVRTSGSTAEGTIVEDYPYALGEYATAEGYNTIAAGLYSHAEGYGTTVLGGGSHAEGSGTLASQPNSHAEGTNTVASGSASHAEGSDAHAIGHYSHAQNISTYAAMRAQTAIGTYNIEDTTPSTAVHPNGSANYGNYAFIIGNGTSDTSNRSNAFTVDWRGETRLYLDSTDDATLISDISSLGWTNDVIE